MLQTKTYKDYLPALQAELNRLKSLSSVNIPKKEYDESFVDYLAKFFFKNLAMALKRGYTVQLPMGIFYIDARKRIDEIYLNAMDLDETKGPEIKDYAKRKVFKKKTKEKPVNL